MPPIRPTNPSGNRPGPKSVARVGASQQRGWYYARNKQRFGPFSLQQFNELAQNGQLLPTDLVLAEGSAGWSPASRYLQEAAPAPPRNTGVRKDRSRLVRRLGVGLGASVVASLLAATTLMLLASAVLALRPHPVQVARGPAVPTASVTTDMTDPPSRESIIPDVPPAKFDIPDLPPPIAGPVKEPEPPKPLMPPEPEPVKKPEPEPAPKPPEPAPKPVVPPQPEPAPNMPTKHPVFWVLDDEPKLESLTTVWLGYPSKRWQAVEKDVETQVLEVRKKNNLADAKVFEELRFIGRAQARESTAENISGHRSKHWGFVADRARVLYGWEPAQWSLPLPPGDAPTHFLSDNHFPAGTTGEFYFNGWMNSPAHRTALMQPHIRSLGMSIGGPRGMSHLVFAGLPVKRHQALVALQPLYQQLEDEQSVAALHKLLAKVVAAGEGSSFIYLAPLLKDKDVKVRREALQALADLYAKVPKAKGVLFALVDLGCTNDDDEVAEKSMALLSKHTGQSFKTAPEWRDWWSRNVKSVTDKAK